MSTIGDLCVTTSISDGDKLVVWKETDGVTRSVSASVLSAYVKGDVQTPLPINLGGTNATTATQATSNLQYLQSGSAAARSLTSKFQDDLSVKDFGTTVSSSTLLSAVNAAQYTTAGGTVRMPNGNYSAVSIPADYSNVSLSFDGPSVPVTMFGEPPGNQFIAAVARKQMDSTSHAGLGHSSFHVEAHPKGSGLLGPLNADYALTIGHVKQNVGSGTEVPGEMDGMYIGVRNGGATQSDTTGFLADIANYGSGFNALYEAAVSTFSGSTQTARVVNQRAVINNRDGVTYGDVLINGIGPMTAAYYVRNTATLGATIGSLMQYGSDAKGTTFDMPITNDIPSIKLFDINGTTSGNKTLQAYNGTFRVLSTGGLAEILSLDNSGNLNTGGNLTTGGFTASGGSNFTGPSNAFSVRPTFNSQTPYDTGNLTLPNVLTAYSPAVTAGAGALSNATATGSSSTIGKLTFVRVTANIINQGTASNSIKVTLPSTVALTNGDMVVFSGRANGVSGKMLQGFAIANSNVMTITNYDGTYPGANGEVLALSGCYLST